MPLQVSPLSSEATSDLVSVTIVLLVLERYINSDIIYTLLCLFPFA